MMYAAPQRWPQQPTQQPQWPAQQYPQQPPAAQYPPYAPGPAQGRLPSPAINPQAGPPPPQSRATTPYGNAAAPPPMPTPMGGMQPQQGGMPPQGMPQQSMGGAQQPPPAMPQQPGMQMPPHMANIRPGSSAMYPQPQGPPQMGAMPNQGMMPQQGQQPGQAVPPPPMQQYGGYMPQPGYSGPGSQYQGGADAAHDALAAELAARSAPQALARSSMNKVPGNNTVKAKLQLPFGMIYQPFNSEVDVPVVNYNQVVKVVRCLKCRSYINPLVKWTANGNKWVCNLCETDNDTPGAFHCPLDANGQRQDRQSRPELMYGAVDFIASPEYMNRPPMAPTYLVCMDVSVNAVASGLLKNMCDALKIVIAEGKMPCVDRAQFGILTYDTNIHFYTIKPNQTTPHISVVPCAPEPFLPTPEGILASVTERKNEFIALLEALPGYWRAQDCQTVNVSGAVDACRTVLKATGGKLIFVMSTMPTAPGLGLNPSHEIKDAKSRQGGTRIPDEADGLRPSSTWCSTVINQLALQQVSVDLIVAPPQNTSMDLASLNQLCKHSSGDLRYYPGYRPQVWETKLRNELFRVFSRQQAWECVMRVRVSKGWSVRMYSGNYAFRGVDLMLLPQLSEDSTFVVQVDNVDSVVPEPACHLQLAALYTTSTGERRIRVLTTALPTSLRLPELSMAISVPNMAHVIATRAMDEALKGKLADARSVIQSQTASLIAALSIGHPTVPPIADPAYPLDETNAIQQMCLICAGMLKCSAFREGKDISADQRVFYWHRLRTYPTTALHRFFVPILMDLTNLPAQAGNIDDTGNVIMPPTMRLSQRLINGEGVYLMCDGESIYIWIGRGVRPEWLQQIWGSAFADQIGCDFVDEVFGTTNSPLAQRITNIIKGLRARYPANYMKVTLVKQGENLEYRCFLLMSEDRSHSVGASFMDIWQKFTMSRNAQSSGLTTTPQANFQGIYR